MQLLPIILIAAILMADAGLSMTPRWIEESGSRNQLALLIVLAIPLLCLLGQWIWMHSCRGHLDRGRVPGPIMSAERTARLARVLILVSHVTGVLVFGWLDRVRAAVGDLVLVDEVLALSPALVAILLTWAVHYPIETRLREALFIRRLDEGRPIYPMPTRWRYVWRQSQFHVFLLLIPILIILGVSELIDRAAPHWLEPELVEPFSQLATLGAGIVVFLFAPLLMRLIFTTVPMEPGATREALSNVCRQHGVRVRDLLVWRTDGTMINAAVMGFIAPLRYVLITDALLESLEDDEVQAVMAHEVGHVRRHHMPWMVACLLALFTLAQYLIVNPALMLQERFYELSADTVRWFDMVLTGLIVIMVLLGFGWISRRFERQADTFAAQHLSGLGDDARAAGRISNRAVGALRNALMRICRLNSIDPRRKSWRHGSIAWRIDYLESIVDQPLSQLRIDRQVLGIKVIALVCLAGAISYEAYAFTAQRRPEGLNEGFSRHHLAIPPRPEGFAP